MTDINTKSSPLSDSHRDSPVTQEMLPVNSGKRPDRRVVWEWNLRLLVTSLLVVGVLVAALGGLYVWQSSRLAEGILARAAAAEQAGDLKERTRWLNRYVNLVPSDVDAQVDLALAVDASVTSVTDLDLARRSLSAAIIACGTSAAHADQKKILREKLISRLVQMGPIWASEAERQLVELGSPAGDPAATKWMAQALAAQFDGTNYKPRDAKQHNAQTHPWRWLSTQPPGDVLYRAWSLNKDDVDLASSLIAACLEHPEWFQNSEQSTDPAPIPQIAQEVVEHLQQIDDGHAQWTVYVYQANSDNRLAQQKLQSAVEGAFVRLEQYTAANKKLESASNSSAQSTGDSLQALTAARPELAVGSYQPYWDWQIVSELARLTAANEPAQALTLYKRLLENDSVRQLPQQREEVYVAYGSLVAQLENIPAAIAIWKEAALLLPKNLELTRMLASASVIENDFDQARAYLNDLQSIIDEQTASLAGPVGAQLTTLVKQSIRERLDAAHWQTLLLQARINFASADYRGAVRYAQQAFDSPLILAGEQRVEAGSILAESYKQLQLWDMAGHTLDRCIVLSPADMRLRRAAAIAWTNMGTADRANFQMERLDDGSFDAALEIARLTAYAEAAKPEELADPSAVTAAIAEARRRYQVPSADASAADQVWQLDLLELNYSDVSSSASADTPSSSSSDSGSGDPRAVNKMDRLQQIAQAYPNVSEVQMLAASSLALVGRHEDSQQALQRLETIAKNSGEAEDAANLAVARANTLAVREGWKAAIASIRLAISELPSQALRLANVGAELALQSNQPKSAEGAEPEPKYARTKVAFELLASVPEGQLDTGAYMTLASLATSLHGSAPDQIPNIENKLSIWEERLKKIEGEEEGTHWRYLAANRLLVSAASASNPADVLNAATRLFNEIDARRPRWGLAASLGAQIAIAKGAGFTDESIALLQRAIRDGDRQINTVWLLIQQLKNAGRLEQAEKELQRIGRFSESFLPMSAMMVDLAQGRGDFDQAVTAARNLLASKPEDYTSWLLLSQTLLTASNKVGIAESAKLELMQEAGDALNKAHELSQGRDINVWDARYRFQLASGDKAAAQQILLEMEQSSLPDEIRLLAVGRGYLQLKDYAKARERFEACIAINPKASAAYLALSDLHQRMGDAAASLDALRKAHTAIPNDFAIRDRLALNLAYGAVGDESQAEQRAAEIQRLLRDVTSRSAPRTRLVKAIIELDQGNAQQQSDALLDMRDIAAAASTEGADAKRILANRYATQWLKITELLPDKDAVRSELETPEAKRNFNDAISFYAQLTSASSPIALDVARHADFLLKAFIVEKSHGNVERAQTHLASTEQTLRKLESISGSSIVSLQLRSRLALAKDEREQLESITADWIKGAGELDPLQQQNITELAGRTLVDLGLVEDSLVWLEKVYLSDPSKYQLLAVALAKAQKFDRALQLSVTGYQNQPSATAAALIAEVAMLRPEQATSPEVDQHLQDAVRKFNESPDLLEAYATLRLLQERYEEAAVWFQAVEKIDPTRVRTLNNLAMALSELPMGKDAAVRKIEKAIDLQGRAPELLDTLGIVLHRNGQLEEAKKVLHEATALVNDPRFQLHLAQIALDQKDSKSAQQAYAAIDKSTLDVASLNAEERGVWAQLQQQFGKE